MKDTIRDVALGVLDKHYNQHGNAKNADIKRASWFFNNTFICERWYILVILSIMAGIAEANHIKNKNESHKNEERRKEELHQAQLKRLEKED